MLCPFCNRRKAAVLDSRHGKGVQARLRECQDCGQFFTIERLDTETPPNWQRLAKLDRHSDGLQISPVK